MGRTHHPSRSKMAASTMAREGDLGRVLAVGGRPTLRSMIDHFGINCSDFEASARFYDEVLAVLGYSGRWTWGWPSATAARATGVLDLVVERAGAQPRDALRLLGLERRGRAGVLRHRRSGWAESLRAAALAQYHPGYYGAFVRDPDGNNVEAVCHGARRRLTASVGPRSWSVGWVGEVGAGDSGRGLGDRPREPRSEDRAARTSAGREHPASSNAVPRRAAMVACRR